jgi:hypothetical protein
MITYSDMIALSDYFRQMTLIIDALRETLMRIEPGDRFILERELLIADLLLHENEKVLISLQSDVSGLRNGDIRANLAAIAQKSPHVLEYLDGDD